MEIILIWFNEDVVRVERFFSCEWKFYYWFKVNMFYLMKFVYDGNYYMY